LSDDITVVRKSTATTICNNFLIYGDYENKVTYFDILVNYELSQSDGLLSQKFIIISMVSNFPLESFAEPQLQRFLIDPNEA